MDEIQLFGIVDQTDKGKIKSEYPAWMHKTGIEDMQEEIDSYDRGEKLGIYPHDPDRMARVKMKRERLEAIKSSKPKLTDKQKDDLVKQYERLGEKISAEMPTRSQMEMGTVDAHEEAMKMIEPGISMNPELAKSCNIRLKKGKVSRDDATKAWKIVGALLGEPTNAEVLRRDRKTGTHKSEDPSMRE